MSSQDQRQIGALTGDDHVGPDLVWIAVVSPMDIGAPVYDEHSRLPWRRERGRASGFPGGARGASGTVKFAMMVTSLSPGVKNVSFCLSCPQMTPANGDSGPPCTRDMRTILLCALITIGVPGVVLAATLRLRTRGSRPCRRRRGARLRCLPSTQFGVEVGVGVSVAVGVAVAVAVAVGVAVTVAVGVGVCVGVGVTVGVAVAVAVGVGVQAMKLAVRAAPVVPGVNVVSALVTCIHAAATHQVPVREAPAGPGDWRRCRWTGRVCM